MGEMQFEPFETGGAGAAGGGGEITLNAGNIGLRHFTRYAGQHPAKGDGRGRDGFPIARIFGRDMIIAIPWAVGIGLAPGMGDLDAGHGACGLDGGGDPGKARDVIVAPQAKAIGADAAIGRNTGGLDNHQTRTAARKAGIMGKMPIRHEAVFRAVLAHGRHRDAVAQGNILQAEGGEKCRHGGVPYAGISRFWRAGICPAGIIAFAAKLSVKSVT